MSKKTIHFAAFDPPLWAGLDPSGPASPVLDVHGQAPMGSPRGLLKTKVFPRSVTPHSEFNAFNGRHDVVHRVEVYASADDDGPESDVLQEQIYIRPSEFQAYELRRNPGWLYLTASDSTLKQMFRRYRETTNQYNTVFNRRVVRIGDLERSLAEMEIVGYTLANVRSMTPISSLDVLVPFQVNLDG